MKPLPAISKLWQGDDCDRPSCDDMISKLQAASAAVEKNESAVQCPPGSSELGRGTWNLLHSMAAWYPEQPTTQDQRLMTGFFISLAQFYPCTWCARDFAQNIEQQPPQVESRQELCQWLCAQHNLVNEKTGKEEFPCDMASLDERWRKSSNPKCQGGGLHRSA